MGLIDNLFENRISEADKGREIVASLSVENEGVLLLIPDNDKKLIEIAIPLLDRMVFQYGSRGLCEAQK